MPVEIELFWFLSNPKWAMIAGVSIIIFVAGLSYALMQRLQIPTKDRFKPWMALAAEILVSVGVIGLVTFAARAKIDSDIRQAQKQVNEDRRLIRAEMINFIVQRCLSVSPKPIAQDEAAVVHACNLSFNLVNAGDAKFIDQSQDFVNWFDPKNDFIQMAIQVKNSLELSNQLVIISKRLNSVIGAESVAYRDIHKKGLVESDVSWLLIALSSALVMIGIGLKWSRAFLEFKRPVEKLAIEKPKNRHQGIMLKARQLRKKNGGQRQA
jgi:hypothetical protein